MSGNSLGKLHPNAYALYNYRLESPASGEVQSLTWDDSTSSWKLGTVNGAWIAFLETDWIKTKTPAKEFLPSWNFSLIPETSGYRFLLQVKDETGNESPWFYLGTGGNFYDKNYGNLIIKSEGWGRVNQDYLVTEKDVTEFKIRVELSGTASENPQISIDNIYLFYSGSQEYTYENTLPPLPLSTKINVPYRSQLDVEEENLKHIVCCPTCVSMVMEFHGINKPTIDVCNESLDEEHGIYGIWPKASQTAAQNGLGAFVFRFSTDEQVKYALACGQPIMASIRVKEGELRNARYPKSNGHLILIIGYDSDGNFLVNDPYSVGPTGAEIVYYKEDMDKVWLDRGGVGILIFDKKAEAKCLNCVQ